MNKNQEYQRLSAEAQDLADRAKNEKDRAAWQRIARSWLGLMQKPLTAQATNQEHTNSA
jgi:cell division protein FtsB